MADVSYVCTICGHDTDDKDEAEAHAKTHLGIQEEAKKRGAK